jgi:hypothetical protein
MSEEWGPWIDHDGAEPNIPDGVDFEVEFTDARGKLVPASGAEIDTTIFPGFFWRWKTVRVVWFRHERRRVCDDPAYAPIIRYRIRKPRALLDLIEMVENLPDEVDA